MFFLVIYVMSMPKVRIWGYRCERCLHEWVPRDKGQDPKVCPKCKSPYWDTPRQSDTNKKKTEGTNRNG
jgi:rRNA maturation endonuclease Nob1